MTSKDVLLHTLRLSRDLIAATVSDLSATDLLFRPPSGGNCAGFILGHLVWVERQALTRSGAADLPPMDPQEFDAFAQGQTPPGDVETYGDPMQFAARFAELRALTMKHVRGLAVETLVSPASPQRQAPFPMFGTVGEMFNFIGMHTMLHAGQITMIRRALGRPPLL